MANHFLKTKAARELPLAKILRMHEDTAYAWFCRGRWPNTDGQPDGCLRCPSTKRPFAIRRRAFKCRDCRREFSVTSGTPFASHKLSFRNMLALVAMARDGVKGRAALEVFRILGLDYKSAWVNLMKLREALCLAQDAEPQLDGVVEMDALHIGGHVRPINDRERDPPRHRVEHGRMARRAVLGMRELGGRVRVVATIGETAPAVTMAAQRYISPNALVITDEAAAYDILPALFQHTARVNHNVNFVDAEGTNTNHIESYFGIIRRQAHGVYHRIAGTYLLWYAAETAWQQNHRRVGQHRKLRMMLEQVMAQPVSGHLKGYWQNRHPDWDALLFDRVRDED